MRHGMLASPAEERDRRSTLQLRGVPNDFLGEEIFDAPVSRLGVGHAGDRDSGVVVKLGARPG
jgi:hypothetical protein